MPNSLKRWSFYWEEKKGVTPEDRRASCGHRSRSLSADGNLAGSHPSTLQRTTRYRSVSDQLLRAYCRLKKEGGDRIPAPFSRAPARRVSSTSSGALGATGEHEKVTTARSKSRGAAAATERPRRRCGRRGDSSSVAMAVAGRPRV